MKKTYEWCSYCCTEVDIKGQFTPQICPNCGIIILPCSICEFESCKDCPFKELDNDEFHAWMAGEEHGRKNLVAYGDLDKNGSLEDYIKWKTNNQDDEKELFLF